MTSDQLIAALAGTKYDNPLLVSTSRVLARLYADATREADANHAAASTWLRVAGELSEPFRAPASDEIDKSIERSLSGEAYHSTSLGFR